ncbi:TonB-dependent hemoglobin/transferrin/lactoferrin family receptor [Endozoicomonas arenosclerae]|uniref:TonB-dependent hemoglobin/transferrin/lactoferrin family receptor n=1 Tax=Endozoicomonas arenosclerae TaxID=1633495 RepID=UPI000AD0538F|nr:TonB-dependent hemoglobin/transferrin/lactoferrin family receptor [Endozoicomonas arenosclerae]
MFTKNQLAIAIIAATPALALAANNQEAPSETPVTKLNKITVTAARTAKEVNEIAGSVSVIDTDEMEKNIARSIRDMVRYEPGVEVSTDGRTGMKDFNIRGMDGNRVKILVDGVDQARSYQPGGNYIRSERSFIDVDALKAVEIVKGPASSLHGSDAIGGLVAFRTKDPADYLNKEGNDSYASIKGGYASANKALTETLTLANRSGDLETMLLYTRSDYQETETYEGADVYGSGRGKADPLDAGLNNLLAKAQYQLNEANRVGITGEFYQLKTETDLRSSTPDNVKGDDESTRGRIGVFHEWEANLAAFDSMRWQFDWQESESHMLTRMPTYNSGRTTYPNRLQDYTYTEELFQLSGQFNKALNLAGLDHQLIYGFNIGRNEVTNKNVSNNLDDGSSFQKNYIPLVTAEKYALFLQDEITITDRLTVTPSIRYDQYEYKPEATAGFTGESKNSDAGKATGRIGATYQLTDTLSTFTQFSQGFKAPDLNDMYHSEDSGRGYLIKANPDLKPEESDSIEVGLRGSGRLGSFEVAAYFNKYKNFIESVTSQDPKYPFGVIQYQNIDEAEIKGIELSSQVWLDELAGAPAGTTFRTSLAYSEGEDTKANQPLNSITPLKAVFGLAYDDPSEIWGSEVIWTLVAAKDSDDIADNEDNSKFATDGYGLVDVTAYYKPVKSLSLRAGIFNLTDKKYRVWNEVRNASSDVNMDRYSEPGRNFSISAKYEF